MRETSQGAATPLNPPIDYLIGKPLASYVADADRREFRIRLHRARDGMQTQECTLHLTHHALPPTLVAVSISPVPGSRGGVSELRILLRAVTNARASLGAA